MAPAEEAAEANSRPIQPPAAYVKNPFAPCKKPNGPRLKNTGGFSSEEFARYEHKLLTECSTTTGVPWGYSAELDDLYKQATSVEEGVKSSSSSSNFSHDVNDADAHENASVPPKRQRRFIRHVRHLGFTAYRRLFSVVFLANAVALAILLTKWTKSNTFPASTMAIGASSNILVAILIRQDYIINFLFRAAWLIPHSTPLRLRCMLAKTYEYGGIHSGASVAGTMWFTALTASNTAMVARKDTHSIAVLVNTYLLLGLLVLILAFAYPGLRASSHNAFELTHRFMGWTAIGLFWLQVLLMADSDRLSSGKPLGVALIKSVPFWLLVVTTFHVILPWMRLRKWKCTPQKLSDHALCLRFPRKLAPYTSLAISDSPLLEWHPFAVFPSADGENGCVIISNAGDWTRRAIQNPSTHYWVRNIPRAGVIGMTCMFKRVVIVTTGSGIGPCLSFISDPVRGERCRVLWSTPNPTETFGQEIIDAILRADSKAQIIDTHVTGRQDMVQLTYQLYLDSGAEAVVVISNPRLTRKVVYGMESRGIPAFGPIWDS